MDFFISRFGANGRIRGKARSIFQVSGEPPLTLQRLEVYADGTVRHDFRAAGCDLDTFEERLARGVIDIVPSRQLHLSEFGPLGAGLGTLTLGEYEPAMTRQDMIDWAAKVVSDLNPRRIGLVDFQGQEAIHTVEPRPGVTVQMLKSIGISGDWYEREGHDGTMIAGKPLRVVHRRDGDWRIDDMIIYADGRVQLGADGAVEDMQDIAEGFRRGHVLSKAPDGEWIGFAGLGRLKPSSVEWKIAPDDLFAEAKDIFTRLQGKPGCAAFCLAALKAYEATPDAETLDILRSAYEWTPAHMRLGSLDSRENVIRAYLGLPPVFDYGDYCPVAGPFLPRPRADLVRPVQ